MLLDILESQQSQTWPLNLQQLFSDPGDAFAVAAVDVGKLDERGSGWVVILILDARVMTRVIWLRYCSPEYYHYHHDYPCHAYGAG